MKISKLEDLGGGCRGVVGFTEETRPVCDKADLALFKSICADAPARYSPYHIALIKAGKLVPDFDPPALPAVLRQMKHKRSSSAAAGNEKAATWVASHLCHSRRCVNPDCLCWEPSWMNRIRDNCPGGDQCVHRPHPCRKPHRPSHSEIIDWTAYL